MNSRRQELCERIAEVHAQPRRTRRYGAELKRAAVAYALERSAEGLRQDEIAKELGLSSAELGKWLRHARVRTAHGRQPFAPSEMARLRAAEDGDAPAAAGRAPASAPESEPAPRPLMLVIRLEGVSIDSDARAQLRAWLGVQPEP